MCNPAYQVVQAILYRLKTGCQWRQLPTRQFFQTKYSWESVYYHFKKWSKDGSWDSLWNTLRAKYKNQLDLSSAQLDGTHTPAKRGGGAVAHQGRKKAKTSNMLIMTDSQGLPVTYSEPISGNHNDAYNILDIAKEMILDLKQVGINHEVLFLNADAGFDVKKFRDFLEAEEIVGNIDFNKKNNSEYKYLFDELLYKERFVVERTNAWLDAFKGLLIRFETKTTHWKSMNILAFIVIWLRKL
ncbi:MAG: IS5 family transposase [Bacteroidales bacterium]